MESLAAISDQNARSKSQLGNVTITLKTGRTFLLNVPDIYEHGQSYPLVLAFHGGESASLPD